MIFVLISLVLLDSLSGGQAQTCTWNEAATTYTRAVGSSVTFTLTVAGEVLTNADRITWKLGTADLVVLRYSSTAPTFTEITSTDGVTAASQSNSHSLTISSLPISYNAQEITVISGGCTVNDVSNVITLNVQYGNLESFQPEAYATDQPDCSFNCVRTFRCYSNGDLTFTATLQADTTWDVEYEIVTRAVGANFSAAIIATCGNLNDYTCDVTYDFANNEHSRITIALESETKFSGILNIFSSGAQVRYNYMKASTAPPRIIVNITVIPSSENEFEMTLKTQNLCRGDLATVKFVGCQNHTEFQVVLPDKSSIARYLDEGTVICTKSNKGRAVLGDNSEVIKTQCLEDVAWKYASNITCLYPIAADLRIDGKPYMKRVHLSFNQSRTESNEAFVQCVRSDGSQNTSNPAVILPQQQMGMFRNNFTINIHPNINGENVSCYYENRYTTAFGPFVSTSLLNISFGPYPPRDFQSLCYFNNGSIKFYSNPASTESILSLWQGENEQIPAIITECREINYGVIGQLITPNKPITGASVRLRRNYSGRIEHFNVIPCPSVAATTTKAIDITLKTDSDSTSTEDVQDAKPTDSTMVAMLCIGTVLLLITFSLITFLYRRRQNKEKRIPGDDKTTLDNEVQRNYSAGLYEEVNVVPTKPAGNLEYINVVRVTTRNDTTRANTLLAEINGYQTASFSANQSTYEYVSIHET